MQQLYGRRIVLLPLIAVFIGILVPSLAASNVYQHSDRQYYHTGNGDFSNVDLHKASTNMPIFTPDTYALPEYHPVPHFGQDNIHSSESSLNDFFAEHDILPEDYDNFAGRNWLDDQEDPFLSSIWDGFPSPDSFQTQTVSEHHSPPHQSSDFPGANEVNEHQHSFSPSFGTRFHSPESSQTQPSSEYHSQLHLNSAYTNANYLNAQKQIPSSPSFGNSFHSFDSLNQGTVNGQSEVHHPHPAPSFEPPQKKKRMIQQPQSPNYFPSKSRLNSLKVKAMTPCGDSLAKKSEKCMLDHVTSCPKCSSVPGLPELTAEWKREENRKATARSSVVRNRAKAQAAAKKEEGLFHFVQPGNL